MAIPLLTTKLCIPPVRPELVPRPRLLQRLDEGLRLGHRLTIVSAPAGFGKTTLLGAWVRDCGRPVAWLSLDEGDADPARFLAYLIAALQEIEEDVGKGALSALQAPQLPPVESILATLVNEIAAVPGPFVLVLDDYHEVNAQPVHSALTFLLDRLPSQMHVVIATRVDPPLPIARLRGRGQLTELRQADLRFTLDESAEFLNRVVALELAADDQAALISRTEGWIAGLQMAALAVRSYKSPRARLPQPLGSIQRQRDISDFIRTFTGSDRYILDYLVEEVLRHQPEDIQAFLLQTSILDRLSGPLCDAVLGIGGPTYQQVNETPARSFADSQAVLEHLEHANLFVVPLDNHREWYRYHRLFADLLRQRLQQSPASILPAGEGDERAGVFELHRRASRWYERNGFADEAIEHALSAEDFERAADLVERIAEATLMRSEVATLMDWVEALPDELVRTRPSLCLFHAWALLLGGRPLGAVESRLRSAGIDLVSSKVAPLRAFVAVFQGQMSRAAELSRQALERLPEDDRFLRSAAAWILSMSHLAGGDLRDSGQALGETARVSQEVGNVLVAVGALNHLAELRMRQGHLHQARVIYEQALGLAADEQGRFLPIAGEALIGLGNLAREWNDLEVATRYLMEGIELTRQWGKIGLPDGYITLARVRQAQGDPDGARDLVQKAHQLVAKFDLTEVSDLFVVAFQARLDVAQSRNDPGRLEAARRWVEERGPALSKIGGLAGGVGQGVLEEEDSSTSSLLYDLCEYEQVTLARVYIAQGRPDEAVEVLAPLLPAAERLGRMRRVLELLILQALALQARGDDEDALTVLNRALSLAEPEGYVRMLVDEGPPMARLLHQAAARGIAPEYAGRLLAAFSAAKPALASEEAPSAKVVEPLSERELEVLRLVAAGLSNKEIAQELFIAVGTVKNHLKSIYGKLDVHSRTQAAGRGRDLGLL